MPSAPTVIAEPRFPFVVLGIAAAAQAWFGWRINDRAVREGQELPAPGARAYLAAGVVAVAIALCVGLFVA